MLNVCFYTSMVVYTVFYKSEEEYMLGVISIILAWPFLYDLLSDPLFLINLTQKELNSGSLLPTQVRVFFILKT